MRLFFNFLEYNLVSRECKKGSGFHSCMSVECN